MTIQGNKIDFLAVGDIVVDAFIRLKDAHVHCKIDSDACELCVRFGDKIPYESVDVVSAVGNSPNAAVSAARLGLRSALVTNIGDDEHGKECLESLKKDNVDVSYITTEKDKKTNYHYVLWYDVDRTILVKHTEFNYKFPRIENVSWMYLSSLADKSLPYHMEIVDYLKNHPETKLAFQPGTWQITLGAEKLPDIFAVTEIFFSNLDEARRILKMPEEQDVKILLAGLRALGPKTVVLTDGPRGAFAYDGTNTWQMPIYPDPAPPVERTGAGDAFASTFTAMRASGLSIPEALRRIPPQPRYAPRRSRVLPLFALQIEVHEA